MSATPTHRYTIHGRYIAREGRIKTYVPYEETFEIHEQHHDENNEIKALSHLLTFELKARLAKKDPLFAGVHTHEVKEWEEI